MPDTKKLSPAAVGVSGLLGVFALLLYLVQLVTLTDLAGSDPAGNAYAQAYGAIEIILLWILLCALTLIAFFKGAMPKPAAVAAFILVPASGFIAFEALELLSRPYQPPHLWPLIIPASVPPLVVVYCFWALLPRLRTALPARPFGVAVWGLVFVICAAIVPFDKIRNAADERDAAVIEKYEADYARLPADAPLWDWAPFFNSRNSTKVNEILERVKKLDRRQADAELMLERGDFPLRYIGALDLTPTPALCDRARALLRKRVAPLVLTEPESKPFRAIAEDVSDALAAMRWLIGYDCDATAEVAAWETMVKGYKDPAYDVYELRDLRDPKNLGNIVRNYPERFSQLTQKAHLRAWLSFEDKKEYHDQALAGARQLEHRIADAVEMLRAGGEGGPWTVLRLLPVLDLEATPALCGTALAELHKELARIHRPQPDQPMSYKELLDRLGTGDQFGALVWLASHGCDAEAGLTEAEDLIRTYQTSPASAAMLDRLAKLRRAK
ncbi:MAG: hypothetical protein PSV22_20140 [Pseudolabrys sp.]|nr:hypothetical protein [Pseudolabrys sp.]